MPTNAQVKFERAIELFNGSEHPETVAGIARTLGPPHVSASASRASAAEVLLTVAWDLSWYQYAVDLSEADEPVRVRARGEQLDEVPDELRNWNAQCEPDGRLAIDASEDSDGAPVDQAV